MKDTQALPSGQRSGQTLGGITGDDGFVYLMRATSPATVYVISAAGDVIRKISIGLPTNTGRPDFAIRVVKNRLAVEFNRCPTPSVWVSCKGTVYTLVNATTGQRLADYEAEKETAGILRARRPTLTASSHFRCHPAGVA